MFRATVVLICSAYFLHLSVSQTCQTSGIGSALGSRFSSTYLDELCFEESTSTCQDTGGFNSDTNSFYNCGLLSQGIERCACIETSIRATVVFLIDGTGRSELNSNESDDLWSFYTSYWPIWYIQDIARNQSGYVDYSWIIFGSDVEYTFTLNDDDNNAPTLPDWPSNALPDNLKDATTSVDFCSAFEAAQNIFNANDNSAKILIYSAYNTPAKPTIDNVCDGEYDYSFDGIDTYAIRWSNGDVDLDVIEDNFGYFTQCTYVTENGGWYPESFSQSRPVLRYPQGTGADFVCTRSNR